MKILLFHTYNQGYLSSFFHELSVKLIKEGHEVVSFSWKATVSEQLIDKVKVIVKKKKGYLINYHNVYSIVKKEKPEVILSNFSYVNPALLFGKIFGVKKNMVWFHSLNEQMESSKKDVYIKRQFLKFADILIANSYYTKEELQTFYQVPNKKIKAVPFWSTISEQHSTHSDIKFTSSKEVIKIGCPGRMATHKNQKILIEALATIKEKHQFHLYFAGVGEELSNLVKQVEELELATEVTFLKHLTANDMLHFYKTMDVVVLPSLHEAFGLVFIEAISLGTPVIVSSQFGALNFIKEDTNEVAAFTFNPESANDLSLKLLPYLKKEGLSPDYFKQLYKKNFDKEVIFKNILNIMNIE